MKVSCLPVSFFKAIQEGDMSVKDWVNTAKICGLDAVDLSMLLVANHTPVYLSQLKKDLSELPLVMMTAYPDFTHPDALQRQRERDYFYRDIALASALGAKYLRMTPGQAHPEMDVKQGVGLATEAFKRSADIAHRYGVKLLFENHSKPGCWRYPDFSHPTEIFLKIADGIRDTDIGINFDTANTIVYGSDVFEVLDKVMDRIVTIHAADTAERGALKPTVVGEGIVPFDGIFKKLKESGFDGWICIEEASNTGIEGVKKAVGFVRAAWANA
ncbi:MAG: sugar phosphate isomerase/epimerase [Eubacteriales bacterium]|nr:sugar phosphate isomerase/epimerase [Eubacteriales bacterium]